MGTWPWAGQVVILVKFTVLMPLHSSPRSWEVVNKIPNGGPVRARLRSQAFRDSLICRYLVYAMKVPMQLVRCVFTVWSGVLFSLADDITDAIINHISWALRSALKGILQVLGNVNGYYSMTWSLESWISVMKLRHREHVEGGLPETPTRNADSNYYVKLLMNFLQRRHRLYL